MSLTLLDVDAAALQKVRARLHRLLLWGPRCVCHCAQLAEGIPRDLDTRTATPDRLSVFLQNLPRLLGPISVNFWSCLYAPACTANVKPVRSDLQYFLKLLMHLSTGGA